MEIYVLIILCLYTLQALIYTIQGYAKNETDAAFAGFFKLTAGIIAIIFQSILL